MKICMIANGDARDKATWSGTAWNLFSRWEKEPGVEIVTVDLNKLIREKLHYKIYNLYCRIVGKLCLIKNSPRDPFVYEIESKIVCEELTKINADVNIFIAEHCLNEKYLPINNSKNYLYVDATLTPLYRADDTKKAFDDWFLKKYEANEKKCFKCFDKIFSMNDWCKKSITELYDIDENKILNVGFGINTSYYEGTKDYTNHHLLIVLRKGSEHIKGFPLLLKGFKLFKKEFPDAVLSVVGTDGPKEDGVTYYYNYPREKTKELFREASLYVMPAMREPNGITYLEALANKTITVGLNRFAFPEFCGFGKYGFALKENTPEALCDVLKTAFSSPEGLEEMGLYGQKFVKDKYSWNQVAKTMMCEFEK